MTRRLALVLAALLAVPAAPAGAQLVVHDPTSYASLVRQAQTALDQLQQLRAQVDEARRLYDSFNTASGAGGLAAALDAPALRKVLPDLDAWTAAARGDLAALGRLGERASTIRQEQRLFTAPAGDAARQDLERAGDRAARDAALGQGVAEAGAERLAGLQALSGQLDGAGNIRAVLDLQARLAAEQAMTANDQLRLQGLAMAQDAEARLQDQRDRERAAAAVEARLARLRQAFR